MTWFAWASDYFAGGRLGKDRPCLAVAAAAPSARVPPPHVDLANDFWLKASIWTLWFCGACYLLLGCCFPVAMFVGPLSEGGGRAGETAMVMVFAVVLFAVGGGCAVGNFAVARGLAQRKKWAWIGTVIVGGLYAPSGCLPFGALLLYAMLRPGVKETFEAEATERAAALLE